MGAYTVVSVEDKVREWATRNGAPWKSYRVTLRNSNGDEMASVEISRNATAPAPQTGESVEGNLKKTDYGPKLEEPRKGGGGFGRAKSPEERRSIAMQSSNQRGVEVVQIAATAGAFQPKDLDEVVKAATIAADAFYQRVLKAEAGA